MFSFYIKNIYVLICKKIVCYRIFVKTTIKNELRSIKRNCDKSGKI
jgi:hypothetical protein